MSYYDLGNYYRGTQTDATSTSGHWARMEFGITINGELEGKQVYVYIKWGSAPSVVDTANPNLGLPILMGSGIAPLTLTNLFTYKGDYNW